MSTNTTLEKQSELEQELAAFEKKLQERRKRFVKCSNCKHKLTHVDNAISVGGYHQHTKTNPFGLAFRFKCFDEALGCAIEGEPVAADSWFEGCVWQYLQCGSCEQHLGWYFSQNSYFYGLRTDHTFIE